MRSLAGFEIRAPNVIHQTIEGEVIVIDLDSGNYYSLSETAADVWACLERGLTNDEISDELERAYGISKQQADSVAVPFLQELATEGLVVPAQTKAKPSIGGNIARGGNLSRARLEKYDDLQDLILMDPVHEVDPKEGWPKAHSAAL